MFAAGLPFGLCGLESLRCDLLLRIFADELSVSFAWTSWLVMFRLETCAWELLLESLRLGIVGSARCLGRFSLGVVALEVCFRCLSLWNSRLGYLVEDLSFEDFRSGSVAC